MEVCGKIKVLIETHFPDSWLEELTTTDLDNQLKIKVDPIVDSIFETFYRSILCGEYILESYKKSNKKFDELRLFVNQKLDHMDDPAVQEVLDKHIKVKIINPLGSLINAYKIFSSHISLLTTYPFHEIGFDVNFKSSSSLLTKDLQDKIDLFYTFLNVQIMDHFFNDGDIVYQGLSELLEQLKKSTVPEKLKPAAIEKVNFLKHKWILRQFVYSKKDDAIFNKGYIADGEIREIFDEEEFTTNNEILKKWSKYLENHYGLSNKWQKELSKEAHKLKQKEVSKLSLFKIHRLIKFYKDIQKNPEALRDVVNGVIAKHHVTLKKSDKKVLEKAIIYSLNNYYSLLLESNNTDIGKLETVKNEIEAFQKKFNIDNFFADKKYLEFELSQIQLAYDGREILNHLGKETNLLQSLEHILKRCKKRMMWAYKHHSLIFQLPYKSSLVSTSVEDFPGVYYASTFALPIPKYTNQKEFKEIELQFEKLNLLTKTISSLSPEFHEVSKIKSDLKDNDFKSLEVIGVFTAIVTFVISTIPGFKFIDSFEKAIYFYAILGGTLATMVLSILLMRRGSKTLSKNIIPLISLTILVVCAFVFYLYIKPSSVS